MGYEFGILDDRLRKRIVEAFEREGVVMPYPRQEVWVRGAGQRCGETASQPQP